MSGNKTNYGSGQCHPNSTDVWDRILAAMDQFRSPVHAQIAASTNSINYGLFVKITRRAPVKKPSRDIMSLATSPHKGFCTEQRQNWVTIIIKYSQQQYEVVASIILQLLQSS
jgi:hypothetical protein